MQSDVSAQFFFSIIWSFSLFIPAFLSLKTEGKRRGFPVIKPTALLHIDNIEGEEGVSSAQPVTHGFISSVLTAD